MERFAPSTNTTAAFRKVRWLPRPELFASALCLCLEGCTAEYALNTLPSGPNADQPIAPVTLTEGITATDGTALWTFSPDTGAFSDRRAFWACDLQVVEITLDDKGAMYAAGFQNGQGALYQVDSNGKCTAVRKFPTEAPWSVGFLNKKLFGDEAGALVRLDTTNGMETVVNATVSSTREGCDIVQRADGATYLSALLDRTSPIPANVLERIDPDTGIVLQQLDVPANMVIEGLAEAAGVLYGFLRDGRVFRIGVDNDDTVQMKMVTTSGGPPHFTGAASMIASTLR